MLYCALSAYQSIRTYRSVAVPSELADDSFRQNDHRMTCPLQSLHAITRRDRLVEKWLLARSPGDAHCPTSSFNMSDVDEPLVTHLVVCQQNTVNTHK